MPLIGRAGDFQTIIAENRSWIHVKSELDRVTSTTRLAKSMFGGAAEMLAVETHGLAVKKEVALMAKAQVTDEKVRLFKELWHAQRKFFFSNPPENACTSTLENASLINPPPWRSREF